jgi:hypothetical protein
MRSVANLLDNATSIGAASVVEIGARPEGDRWH